VRIDYDTKGAKIQEYAGFDNKAIIALNDESLDTSHVKLTDDEKEICRSTAIKICQNHIAPHFLELVKTMINAGADPHVRV